MQEEKVNITDPVTGEAVNVPGHKYDIRDDELPVRVDDHKVLIESDMRTDPVEGTQGTYTILLEREVCPSCGTEGMKVSVKTLASLRIKTCIGCNYQEGP